MCPCSEPKGCVLQRAKFSALARRIAPFCLAWQWQSAFKSRGMLRFRLAGRPGGALSGGTKRFRLLLQQVRGGLREVIWLSADPSGQSRLDLVAGLLISRQFPCSRPSSCEGGPKGGRSMNKVGAGENDLFQFPWAGARQKTPAKGRPRYCGLVSGVGENWHGQVWACTQRPVPHGEPCELFRCRRISPESLCPVRFPSLGTSASVPNGACLRQWGLCRTLVERAADAKVDY